MKPEVVGYIRVSSRQQDLATQRSALENASERRGEKITRWYQEKMSATKSTSRPALDEVRNAARLGAVSRLYVFRLDRLARSGIRDTLDVVEEFQRHGVKVVTIADGFDMEGPAAQVVIAVLAWAAQMETLAMRERIFAARTRIEAKGGRWGRPARVDAKTMDKMVALRKRGKTIRAIAVAVKIPKAVVGRALFRWDAGKLSRKPLRKSDPKPTGKRGAQPPASR